MPYSGPKDSSLPEHVKKMSEEMKKQWVAVFNSEMDKTGDEGKAMTMANGVAKKKKDYISSFWAIDKRQLMQETANYNAMGGGQGKGCGNCHWFVPQDDGCILVCGDIMPTGICDHWMAEPAAMPMDPIPVTIIKEKGLRAFVTSLKDAATALLGVESDEPSVQTEGSVQTSGSSVELQTPLAPGLAPVQSGAKSLMLFKTSDSSLRFLTTFSNHFKDKHKEFLKGEAHQEYVDYATKTGNYPDLWLWHSGPSSKWGKVDWLEYSDGFVVASGLVDKDKEDLAYALEKEDLGVSHGFYGLQVADTVYRYRTFEISPLPIESAANAITDINFLSKELEMPFSEAKKTWLKDVAKISPDVIGAWESNLVGLNDKMKALGLEWKDVETKAEGVVDPIAEVAALTKSVSELAGIVATIVEKQKALETDMDTKVANTFAAKIAQLPQGFVATESANNVVTKEKDKELTDFFGDIVLKGMVKQA